ncbi:MAG: tetratricopeptide repeat protein, partial [Candidatus Aminicenantes bacterium RBG_16_66_30]
MDKGPILESWKEIAAHLNRDIRTCHRWERELGLPVHRLDGSPKARVFAYADELDRWLEEKLRHQGVWVRLKKWQRAGLAAALVLLAGAAVYRLAIWPFRPEARRIPLAVLFAVNNSGDKSLNARFRWQIPIFLSMDLAQSKYLSVLPQDRLMQILADSGQMDEEYHMSKTLDRIAEAARVEYFILPSFTKAGDSFWVSFTIRKARTDQALGEPDTIKMKGSEDLLPMAAAMSLKVKSRLSLSSEKIAADDRPDLGLIATTSSEAMGRYIDGEIAYVRGDYEGSIRSLEEAVKEDSNFALAYLKIAIDSEYVGDYSQVRTYLQKALGLADRVSRRDRYLIEGHASYTLDESPLKAIESYQKLIALFPEDVEGRISLGAIRRNLEEWDLALDQFDKILSLDPRNELAIENNVFIYTAKGWYERALGLCEGGLGVDPEGVFFARQLPLLYIIQGRYDRASTELQKALARMPDAVRLQELEGNLYHLKGDLPAAKRIYEQLQRRGEETLAAL